MSGPNTEGGPLPLTDEQRRLIEQHERRIAEWLAIAREQDRLYAERARRGTNQTRDQEATTERGDQDDPPAELE